MTIIQSFAGAQHRRRAIAKPQFKGWVTDVIGSGLERSPLDGKPSPQVFLVEQPPGWELQTHFHLHHQFQVVMRGRGSLGRHAVEPLAVHYASPHSGYGPLVAGSEGLDYLTLRLVGDTGAWYLPDSREHLAVRIPKQQLHASPAADPPENLALLQHPLQEVLIAPDDTGLAAWLVRLPAGAPCEDRDDARIDAGRFYVLTRGGLHIKNDLLEGPAVIYVGASEVLTLAAASHGAEMLVLQFPQAALHPLPA